MRVCVCVCVSGRVRRRSLLAEVQSRSELGVHTDTPGLHCYSRYYKPAADTVHLTR